jgi:hypothetical protein
LLPQVILENIVSHSRGAVRSLGKERDVSDISIECTVNAILERAVMTLSEFEISRCEKLVAEFIQRRRPPPHLRDEVYLAFRINGQSVEIYEVRAHWRDAGKKIEQPFAKATYNKSRKNWKIFWQRADLKWHGYQPHLEAVSIEEFLDVVEKDDHGCFFG